jgi:UDP-N-acetylmuramyl tripeptide synthase
MFGQAGDRTDASIAELAQSAWSIGLDAVVVSELEIYARGRSKGEVFGIIREALIESGAGEDQIQHYPEEMMSLDAALDWAQPGDLVIVLALGARDEILEKLESLSTN